MLTQGSVVAGALLALAITAASLGAQYWLTVAIGAEARDSMSSVVQAVGGWVSAAGAADQNVATSLLAAPKTQFSVTAPDPKAASGTLPVTVNVVTGQATAFDLDVGANSMSDGWSIAPPTPAPSPGTTLDVRSP